MDSKIQIIINQNNEITNRTVLDSGQKASITATDNMRISLLNAETGEPITKLKAKKSGNNLLIADESGDEILTIEDYYTVENIEVGTVTDIGFAEFNAVSQEGGETISSVSETQYTPLVADMLDGALNINTATTTGISSGALWGGLGAVAIGAALINDDDDDSSSSTQIDRAAPSSLTQELGDDNRTITGETEKGAKVTATYNGEVVGTAIAKEDGSYTLNLDKAYANGEAIEVIAADGAGNATESNIVTAPDITAPSNLTQEISTDGTVVSGITEAGATVTVTHNGEFVGTAVAKQDGSYSVSLDPAFSNGEALKVTATDKAGNATEPSALIAPDNTAPGSLTQELGDDNRTITGETEKGAKVTATYNGEVVGTAIAKEDGSYTLNLDKAYANGEAIEVIAADGAGNATESNIVTAPDITAPSNLTQEISTDGTVVSGKTEAGATVTIVHNGKVLGEVEADLSGIYKVELDEKFAGGEELLVTAKDAVGNATEPNALIAPDNTAPSSLTQELGDDNRTITGETEKGAKVTATYNGEVVGTAIAKEDGSYTLNLDKAYANGEAIEVMAADVAGNATEPNTVTAPDTTAPSSLTQEISEDGTVVSGTTEAGATVTVTHNGEVLGEEQADADGSYKISIDKKFAGGEELLVVAKDAAGNATEPNALTAPDITAPSSLTQELGADNQTITGETEAGATVTATYNGEVVGTAIAKEDGSYTLNLDKAYANGEAIEVIAADGAGNATEPSSIYAAISGFTAKSLELDLKSQFETRVESELQTVVDKSSYGSISQTIDFEVTGDNASPKLSIVNPSGLITGSYQISLSGPGISSSNSGSVSSAGSTSYSIDLDTGALSPGKYTMRLNVNSRGSTIEFKVTEYVDVEYQDFVEYGKISGNIFGSEGSPENYELKIDGQSLVYKSNEPTVNSITLTSENGVLDLNADGSYTYSSNKKEGGLGVAELEDSFDIEIFDLNGNESGSVGIDIIPDLNYGESFVYSDGESFKGSEGNDILTANDSVSKLSGGAGDDVYVFTRDFLDESQFPLFSTTNTIVDNQGDDSIQLKDVLDSSTVDLEKSGSDLIINTYEGSGEIVIQDHFGEGSINNIYFANGDSWSRMDIESMINGNVI